MASDIQQTKQNITPNPVSQQPVQAQPIQPELYQQQPTVPAQQSPTKKSATDVLSNFAEEKFDEVQKVIKFVREGHKLDNDAMQQLLLNLKKNYDMSYRDLLAIYLSLDKAVEKGVLTNDLIDYMKDHPDVLQKFDA